MFSFIKKKLKINVFIYNKYALLVMLLYFILNVYIYGYYVFNKRNVKVDK